MSLIIKKDATTGMKFLYAQDDTTGGQVPVVMIHPDSPGLGSGTGGTGGISDAPNNTNYYVRHANSWVIAGKVTFSNSYNDLDDKPTIPTVGAAGASNSYDDLDDKPTIPAAQIQSDWSQADDTHADYIKGKPTIPAAQIQSDWNQADNTKLDYIKNKPAAGSTPGGQTVRNIATRCRTPGFQTSSATPYAFSRTMHINRGNDVASLQIAFANWCVLTGGATETATADALNITAAIEYPLGTYTRVLFSGVAGGVAAAGTTLVSDACAVKIPKGARFWVRSIQNKASGVFTATLGGDIQKVALGGAEDQISTSATAYPTDYTVNAYTGNNVGSNPYFPVAIIGLSNAPSVIIYGDSRAAGLNDQPTQNYGLAGSGEIARQLDSGVAYTNCGCPSDKLTLFLANSTRRTALSAYHTHVHCQYGINDVTGNRTAAQIQADMVTFLAKFSATLRVSQSTILPQTSSTDAWATLANQTPITQDAVRIAMNAYIRARTIGWWAVFEQADVYESARDSGKWKTVEYLGVTAALTGDGTHPSPYGYGYGQKAASININAFVS